MRTLDDDDGELLGADISILPPIIANGDTEEDSGDEHFVIGDVNHLNLNQLLAEASMRFRKPYGDILPGFNYDLDCFW